MDSSDGIQMLPLSAKDIELTGLSWEGSTCWLWLLWEELKGFGETSLRLPVSTATTLVSHASAGT